MPYRVAKTGHPDLPAKFTASSEVILSGVHEVLEDRTQLGWRRGLESNRIPSRAGLGDPLGRRFTGNERARESRSALAFEPSDDIDSVFRIGKAQVAKNDVRASCACALERLITALGGDDFTSPLGEQALHCISNGRFVIDDQHTDPAQAVKVPWMGSD